MGVELAVGAAIVGQGLNAYQTSQNNKYNADVQRFNATQSKIASEEEAEQLAEEEQRVVGTTRAIAGASGIAVDVGSNADVVDDIRRTFAADIAATRFAGDVGVFQGEAAASISESQAAQAITAGVIGAGTTALTFGLSQPNLFTGTTQTGITGANVIAGQGGVPGLGGR